MNTVNRSNSSAGREQKTAGDRPRAELEAEQALLRQKEAADEMTQASQRIVDDAASITRRGTETLQHTVQSGIEMATKVAERSLDQLSTVAGLPNRQTAETAQQSSRQLQAMFDSGAAIADAVQQLQDEMLERAKSRLQDNLDLFETLLRCRNVSELAATQIDYARGQLESMLTSSRRASELVGKAADTALERIKAEPPVPVRMA